MNANQEVILLQLLQALKTNQEHLLLEHKQDMQAFVQLFQGLVGKVQVMEALLIRLNAREEEMASTSGS